MNIARFIKEHKELNNLPFLIVYRTIAVLNNLGVLKPLGGDSNVETT